MEIVAPVCTKRGARACVGHMPRGVRSLQPYGMVLDPAMESEKYSAPQPPPPPPVLLHVRTKGDQHEAQEKKWLVSGLIDDRFCHKECNVKTTCGLGTNKQAAALQQGAPTK